MPDPSPTPITTPDPPQNASSAVALAALPPGLVVPRDRATLLADILILFSPAGASFRDAALNALGSKKWLVMLIALVGTFVALFAHLATWADIKGPVIAIVALYLGAQGVVDATKHIAVAKVASSKLPNG